jgi:hypothetical protein
MPCENHMLLTQTADFPEHRLETYRPSPYTTPLIVRYLEGQADGESDKRFARYSSS